ncbi:unnamed protein product [Adineta steineri]|uniref:Uncharacterized protein n=1 Tax=Adineta steineri TaxID=433720 RepID=A0A813VXS7_9BILA|nr:unnamed protein product [Adineta steineri]CAF1360652.1 unnamed protein product [Adineta steineri]CAF1365832.1 unnamed protein product [Adineta steineri]
MVLKSRSLMYCPVPKVATKTLLTVMLYMHVNDIIDNLEHNWTNIDAGRAQVEKRINIGSYIHELRQYRVDDYINRPTLLENCNQLKTL